MRISGLVRFNAWISLGGATLAGFNLATAQRLFDKAGRLDDINEDLEVIVESGDLSPEMSSRYRELDAERGRLKALLAKASEAPAH